MIRLNLTQIEALCASFIVSIDPISPSQLEWQATELKRLENPPGLWKACFDLWHPAIESEERPDSEPKISWQNLVDHLGRDWTLRALLLFLSREDIFDYLRPALIRHLAAHLDQGLAAWPNPLRRQGFYKSWRASAITDFSWNLAGLPYVRGIIADLPDTASEVITAELTRLGLSPEYWDGYLECLALELPGWSGMFFWRQTHPDVVPNVSVEMEDYLAVRLLLERFYADALCRRRWGVEASLSALEKIHFEIPPAFMPSVPLSKACSHAWPLFHLAQYLALDAQKIQSIGRAGAEQILTFINRLDPNQRAYLWLQAYERHYREPLFAALIDNHGKSSPDLQPEAQWVFCMDDREESLRRHIETVNPQFETLGAAAHFNVPHFWRGLDSPGVVALAPVIPAPVIPSNEIHEQTRDSVGLEETKRHCQRHALRRRFVFAYQHLTRIGLLTPTVFTMASAPLATVALTLKTVHPIYWDKGLKRIAQIFDTPVTTKIEIKTHDASQKIPIRMGFTDAEQASCVQLFLKNHGLIDRFAPLVIVVGHASHSQNNPHASAYNCGACAGRHSGPNARLVSAMANRATVRSRLQKEGIIIPLGTWFLGAEHDTCDDRIIWFDTEDLPDPLKPAFIQLRTAAETACRANAQERCRRFASAPQTLSQEAALVHVAGRAVDFSQARPELGHATNACALIGRRSMSRGLFLDRRAFLISYDPTQDPEGKILERHLLINGAVGAGINLEYYFSTVDNDRYGCGSKVTHNLTGFLGVMDGASSDLRTGLPRQMIEIHEAMRLLVVIEQNIAVITAIYQRQPKIKQIVQNGWVILAAKDPETPNLYLFDPELGWKNFESHAGRDAHPVS